MIDYLRKIRGSFTFKKFQQTFSLFIKKSKDYTFLDFLRFLGRFIFTFAGAFLTIGIPVYIDIIMNQRSLGRNIILIVLVSSFVTTIYVYVKENKAVHKKAKDVMDRDIYYASVQNAIHFLSKSNFKSSHQRNDFIKDLLISITKTIELLLEEENIPKGKICSNIMIPDKRSKHLILKFSSNNEVGHGKRGLKLNLNGEGAMGAVLSFLNQEKYYYRDTTLAEYSKYFGEQFDNEKVLSFVCIPLIDKSGKSFGVLNIDSDIKDQFISRDFLEIKISQKLNFHIDIIRLICDVFGGCN